MNGTFESELESRLREFIENVRDKLENGVISRKEYHRACGTVQAFRTVIDLFPEIRKKINER